MIAEVEARQYMIRSPLYNHTLEVDEKRSQVEVQTGSNRYS
jgi:hypothetical protein